MKYKKVLSAIAIGSCLLTFPTQIMAAIND